MARNLTPVEWTHSKLHGTLEMQVWSEMCLQPLEYGPLTNGGSSGFCIGAHVGGDGLDAGKILGTASLQIFAA